MLHNPMHYILCDAYLCTILNNNLGLILLNNPNITMHYWFWIFYSIYYIPMTYGLHSCISSISINKLMEKGILIKKAKHKCNGSPKKTDAFLDEIESNLSNFIFP
jgi:hypothetical protein